MYIICLIYHLYHVAVRTHWHPSIPGRVDSAVCMVCPRHMRSTRINGLVGTRSSTLPFGHCHSNAVFTMLPFSLLLLRPPICRNCIRRSDITICKQIRIYRPLFPDWHGYCATWSCRTATSVLKIRARRRCGSIVRSWYVHWFVTAISGVVRRFFNAVVYRSSCPEMTFGHTEETSPCVSSAL